MKLKLKNSVKVAQILGALIIGTSAFATPDSGPTVLRGVLEYTDHFSLRWHLGTQPQSSIDYNLVMPATVAQETKSLVGKTPFVEVTGELSPDGKTLTISEVPTQVYGDNEITGVFKSDGQGGYLIEKVPVTFGKTAVVNKATFDQKSRDSFINKYVRANGTIDQNGVFVIQSIIDGGVFSARPSESQSTFEDVQNIVAGVVDPNPARSFRSTLFSGQTPVQPGDSLMIVTASGREGDSAGAVNGHFAAGRGRVDQNYNIHGDMFNVYVTNEKQIIPGDIDVVDYYGHLISGQSNYRPTYTMLVYGISEEKMDKVRDELDKFHPFFRSGNTKITSNTNCATLTTQALADIGIYGTQRDGKNGTAEFPLLSSRQKLPPKLSFQGTLKYILRTPRSEFVPGPAFNAILLNLMNLDKSENLGITRIDFVFGAQTPSSRQVGGAPTTGVLSDLEEQLEIGGTVEAEDVNGKILKTLKKTSLKFSAQIGPAPAWVSGSRRLMDQAVRAR